MLHAHEHLQRLGQLPSFGEGGNERIPCKLVGRNAVLLHGIKESFGLLHQAMLATHRYHGCPCEKIVFAWRDRIKYSACTLEVGVAMHGNQARAQVVVGRLMHTEDKLVDTLRQLLIVYVKAGLEQKVAEYLIRSHIARLHQVQQLAHTRPAFVAPHGPRQIIAVHLRKAVIGLLMHPAHQLAGSVGVAGFGAAAQQPRKRQAIRNNVVPLKLVNEL